VSLLSRLLARVRGILTASLRRQLILGVAGVHAVMMTVFVFDLVERQRDFLLQRQIDDARLHAENLALAASEWVLSRDYAGMGELIAAQERNPELVFAMLVNTRGVVLAHSQQEHIGQRLVDPASRTMLNAQGFVWLSKSPSLTDAAAPILANGRIIGWARTGLSQRETLDNLNRVARDGILYTLAAILVGALLAMLMANRLTRRLHRLRQTMDRVRSGAAGERVRIGGQDEAAALAGGFNAMLDALQQRAVELKSARDALYEEKELAQVTLASIGDAVVTTDAAGRISFLNPMAEQLTGVSPAEALGRPVAEVMRLINEDTGAPAENPVERCRQEHKVVGMANHTVLVSRDGRHISIEDSAAPIFDRQGGLIGIVMVFHDVSEKRALTREMAWQLSHDALTGLVNRPDFERRLAGMLEGSRLEGHRHALLYMDLDQFKMVNDTCGHQAGDELLRQLSTLMQAQIRHADVLARLGGDEFGVLLEDCPMDKAAEIAEKLRNVVCDFRFGWKGRVFEMGVSIGLVELGAGSGSASDALADADMACYAAKDRGRNRVHVHSASDAEVQSRRRELEAASRIRGALKSGRIRLYGQEIRPLRHGESYYEVLMRILDDEGNPQSPAMIIPAAERYGLMGEVDRWVVRRAFEFAAAGGAGLKLSINLSGLSIGDDAFVAFVRDTLKRDRLDASRFCFEITETAAIAHLGQAMYFIRDMKGLGFRFALDDFGSGMSSFAYLKNLPVDYLKIDGVFVRDIVADPIDRAFVETINHIGRVMGKQTIAEFVENEAILQELAHIGVDYVQGYGVARPVPLDSLVALPGAEARPARNGP
jgi:diguanylate cyclase (GGDEF)-like protein/PAS domain S-box-containing protein